MPHLNSTDSNLLLHFKFDVTGAGNTLDSIGNITGTLTGPVLTGGYIRNAITTSVSGNSNISFTFTNPILNGTISFWTYPLTPHDSPATVWYLFDVGDNTNGTLHFQRYSDGNYYIGFFRAGNDHRVTLLSSTGNFVQNTWQNYTITWSNGGRTRLYRNGAFLAENSVATNSSRTNNSWRIGTNVSNALGKSCIFDDFRIYSGVLTTGEIQSLYNIDFLNYPNPNMVII